jgi:GxxExxY protein
MVQNIQRERMKAKKVFTPLPAEVEKVGKAVLDAAYKVHTALGPGLLETVYEACLAYEIRNSGLAVATQPALPVVYNDVTVDAGLRPDIIVENCVIVELKAVEKMIPLYQAQLMTYLKLTGLRLGYLINFNVPHLVQGIKRTIY